MLYTLAFLVKSNSRSLEHVPNASWIWKKNEDKITKTFCVQVLGPVTFISCLELKHYNCHLSD